MAETEVFDIASGLTGLHGTVHLFTGYRREGKIYYSYPPGTFLFG